MNEKNNIMVTAKEVENKKWWSKIRISKPLLLFCIFMILVAIVEVISDTGVHSSVFFCESGESKVEITYKNDKIILSKRSNLNFDFPKVNVSDYGIDKYLMRINKSFYDMTGNLCTIDGEVLELDMFFFQDEDIK